MMRRLQCTLLAACAAGVVACATPQTAATTSARPPQPVTPPAAAAAPGKEETLPAYRRVGTLQGAVQLSGSSAVSTFARAWGSAFQRIYPDAAVTVVSKSSGATVGDMSANPAIIGMMSRAMNAAERAQYAKQHGQPPLEFKVAVDAVAIFVFKDNPLQSISLPQLERIFAAAPKRGTAIQHWGQLGLSDDWAGRAVNGIGFEAGRGAHEIMRTLVLRGGNFNSGIAAEPVSTSVVQAVGVDPGAIGYASVYYRTARTKALPLQVDGGLAQPTEADAASGKYPLARHLYLYLGVPKGGAGDVAREFVRFVLSAEGQMVTRGSGAFAISASLARAQQAALSSLP